MSKIEEMKKEGIIKDTVFKIIKDSEDIAVQTVNSTSAVMKAGLASAEDISIRVSDILLNTARRIVSVGTIVGHDVREAAKNMAKGTIHTALEIGSELKVAANTATKGAASAEKIKLE